MIDGDGSKPADDDLPRFLYRYRAGNTSFLDAELAALRRREVWMSTPTYLNDPFDCNPNVVSSPLGELTEIIRKLGFRKYKRSRLDRMRKLGGRDPETDKRFKLAHRDIVHAARFEDFLVRRTIRVHANNRVKIACFSGRSDSILMWSHYADHHRGYCIEYEVDWEPSVDAPLKVNYVLARSVITTAQLLLFSSEDLRSAWDADSNMDSVTHALYFEKSEDWTYENEWRTLLLDGAQAGYRKLLMMRPTSIILGVNARTELEQKAKELEDILEVRQARMHRGDYAIEIP